LTANQEARFLLEIAKAIVTRMTTAKDHWNASFDYLPKKCVDVTARASRRSPTVLILSYWRSLETMGFRKLCSRLVFAKATVTTIRNAARVSCAFSDPAWTRFQGATELESLIRTTVFLVLLPNPNLLIHSRNSRNSPLILQIQQDLFNIMVSFPCRKLMQIYKIHVVN
jgi:hypothetical protein